jgi:glutathione S-transferase
MKTIWGRLSSVNVAKAVWAAREVNIPFERIDVGGPFGKLDTPEYGALNPNRKIPTLDDDGFILWESNSIVRYLAAQYAAGSLWPTDPRERALSDRWLDWQATEFGPSHGPAFLGLIRTPEEKRDTAAIAASTAKTNKLLAVPEQALADGRNFVAGERFSIGDIALGCVLDRWYQMPIERPAMPHVEQYLARLRARPAAQGVLQQKLA